MLSEFESSLSGFVSRWIEIRPRLLNVSASVRRVVDLPHQRAVFVVDFMVILRSLTLVVIATEPNARLVLRRQLEVILASKINISLHVVVFGQHVCVPVKIIAVKSASAWIW